MATVPQQRSVPQPAPQPPTLQFLSPSPVNASDKDVIEREWTDAVKKAIHDNRDDPYILAVALTRLKVQYMKQRYNEDIKTSE